MPQEWPLPCRVQSCVLRCGSAVISSFNLGEGWDAWLAVLGVRLLWGTSPHHREAPWPLLVLLDALSGCLSPLCQLLAQCRSAILGPMGVTGPTALQGE